MHDYHRKNHSEASPMTLQLFLVLVFCVCGIVVVFGCYVVWNDKAVERVDHRASESRRREVIYNERSMNIKSNNRITETECESRAYQGILSAVSHKKHIICERINDGFRIIATDFDPTPMQTHMIQPSIISPAISSDRTIEGHIIYSDKHFDRIEIREIKQ
jgi:hypothetical protein